MNVLVLSKTTLFLTLIDLKTISSALVPFVVVRQYLDPWNFENFFSKRSTYLSLLKKPILSISSVSYTQSDAADEPCGV